MFACCCTTEEQNEFKPIPIPDFTAEKYPADEPAAAVVSPPVASTSRPASFEVNLDMAGGDTLGIILDNADEDSGPMIKDVTDVGLIAAYNATARPECKVEIYDRIEAVNGKPSSIIGKSSGEELITASEGSKLSLALRKPRRLSVSIDKSPQKPMGINMTYKKASIGIVVKSIDGHGLVSDWNKAHPEAEVMTGDRIVGMNGEDIKSSELIAMMKGQTQYDLAIMHY